MSSNGKGNHGSSNITPYIFWKIIHDRTATKKAMAQEKCGKDLLRISEMKSKTGIHPLDLFPKEIWLQLWNEMDTAARGGIWQIHPLFQDMLEDTRIRDILFPQVLKVLVDRRSSKPHGRWDKDTITRSPIKKLLKLRKVSKSMKNAVDSWFEGKLQEDLQLPYFSEDQKPENWNPAPHLSFKILRDENRLKGIIENYSNGDGKAFFVRSIELHVTPFGLFGRHAFDRESLANEAIEFENAYQTFFRNVIKLLGLVGDQIWHFRLHISDFDEFQPQVKKVPLQVLYSSLRQCCDLMPQLKWLDLTINPYGGSFNMLGIDVKEFGHFPKLEKLERIDILQAYRDFSTLGMYEAILRANPHLKILNLIGKDDLLEKISPGVLQALSLEQFAFGYPTNLMFCSKFATLKKTWLSCTHGWPLKSLKLYMGCGPITEVFEFLEKFPTLEKLDLHLEEVTIGTGITFLKLPNLIDFKFNFKAERNDNYWEWKDNEDYNQFYSLQFLLQAKKLKRLSWPKVPDFWMDVKLMQLLEKRECRRNPKAVNFRGAMRDIRFSNEWKVFPDLEVIEFEAAEQEKKTPRKIVKRCYRPSRNSRVQLDWSI